MHTCHRKAHTNNVKIIEFIGLCVAALILILSICKRIAKNA